MWIHIKYLFVFITLFKKDVYDESLNVFCGEEQTIQSCGGFAESLKVLKCFYITLGSCYCGHKALGKWCERLNMVSSSTKQTKDLLEG